MNHEKISNIQMEGVDIADHPDYCDAFIASADYNGEPMTDKQLDKLNEDTEFIYESVLEQLF